jgi:OmpA-OmpF porin, OOP family
MKQFFSFAIAIMVVTSASSQVRRYTIENNELKTGMPVIFNTQSDILNPLSDSALQEVKSFLADKKAITLLRIESHIAAGGDENKNMELTKKRALAVARWLIKNGVSPERIIAVAFGSSKPVANNSTPESKALNTRISFINAAMLNRAIGGMPLDGGGLVVCNPCNFSEDK